MARTMDHIQLNQLSFKQAAAEITRTLEGYPNVPEVKSRETYST